MLRASVNSLIFLNKMNSKIGFEMSLIVVETIRGRCASFMSLTVNGNGSGDIWWTDKLIYFSSIDGNYEDRGHSETTKSIGSPTIP